MPAQDHAQSVRYSRNYRVTRIGNANTCHATPFTHRGVDPHEQSCTVTVSDTQELQGPVAEKWLRDPYIIHLDIAL